MGGAGITNKAGAAVAATFLVAASFARAGGTGTPERRVTLPTVVVNPVRFVGVVAFALILSAGYFGEPVDWKGYYIDVPTDTLEAVLDGLGIDHVDLLASDDLDELIELADRLLVIAGGRIVFEVPAAQADRTVIGHHMAGHH